MTWRKGHGAGKPGLVRIEVLPPDELPSPVPDGRPDVSGVPRAENGRIVSSAAAKALGSRGGRARGEGSRLARSLGLSSIASNEGFGPYKRMAAAFRRAHLKALAQQAGGEVGPAPASMVASASLQLAASRFLYEKGIQTGDGKVLSQASILSNDSRQNLLAAYELAVKEAKARKRNHVDRRAVFEQAVADETKASDALS